MSIDKLNMTFADYQGPVLDANTMNKITSKIDETVDGVNNCDGGGGTGGGSGNEVVIGDESQITEDTKIFIDPDEVLPQGNDVVDSLEGNETDKAPSVRVINNEFDNVKGKILWTNSNPTKSFGAQTITLNESRLDYDVLEIFFDDYAPYGNYSSSKILSNERDTYYQLPHAITYYASGVQIRSRFFEFIKDENNKIYFYEGTEQGQTDNFKCVPLYIIGYKIGML